MHKTGNRGSSGTLVAFLVVAVDIGLARLGYGLLLPAIRHDLHGSYALYGALGAAHLGGYLGGTLVAPTLLRNRARLPRITAAAHLAVAATLAVSAAARDPAVLGIARTLLGFASGVGIASAITDALERVQPARRGMASALAWSGIGVGLVVSAPGGAWTLVHPAAWRTATLLAAVPALVIVGLAVRLAPQAPATPGAADGALGWRDLIAPHNLFFVAAYAGYGVSYIAYVTFAVAAFAGRGIAPLAVSALWAALGLAATVGAIGVGRLLSSSQRRWSLAAPLLTGAAGSLISVIPSLAGAAGGALCIGVGLAAAPAAASAFARDRSDAASYARAFAGVTIVFGIGQSVGPVLAGAAADAFGLAAVPLLTATVFSVATICAAIDAQLHTLPPVPALAER